MTADAKVGLLLGLVFIVIIAFAINGLPDFVHSFKEKPVVETAVTMQTGGNLVIDPAVVDVARTLQQGRTNLRYVEPPTEMLKLDTFAGQRESSPVLSNIRIPDTTVENPNPGTASEQVVSSNDSAKAPTLTVENQISQPSVSVQTQVPPQDVKTVQAAKQVVQQVQQQPQKSIVGDNYSVQKGESLASISVKHYGPEIGNKKATIQMLYEANKNVLESPDKVQAGDKLIIPQIAAKQSQTSAAGTQKAAVSSFADKFKGVFVPAVSNSNQVAVKNKVQEEKTPAVTTSSGNARPAAVKEKGQAGKKPAETTSEYVVQAGDSLSKIAQKTLGDKERFREIIKLNKDVMANPNDVKVGMKLKLPKR